METDTNETLSAESSVSTLHLNLTSLKEKTSGLFEIVESSESSYSKRLEGRMHLGAELEDDGETFIIEEGTPRYNC